MGIGHGRGHRHGPSALLWDEGHGKAKAKAKGRWHGHGNGHGRATQTGGEPLAAFDSVIGIPRTNQA